MSEGSEIGIGVRQGCPLSSTLFNIYLEDLVKNCFQNMGGVTVGGRRIKCIRFADDMALLAEEEMILRDMLLELNDSCEQYGMKINANKTNTMVMGRTLKKLLEDILFIDSNFKIVSKSITLLESSKLQLSEALNIVDKVSQTDIQNNNSLISEKLKCHDKTSEFGVLKSSDFPFFKYAPITLCDVERTFSQYKNCLSDHRRRFTLQSLKMYVTLHRNAHIQG
ncbi:hypothetical protein ANN_25017 [Periplaneta americana]|uniref:Reverse transcriptase domain-containing protein n=1 Tax=Periplaneta americana TaxID=6978 RepID=A0ABQ8S0D8_PERAM|nr:hypothetical protein ANN_25017 [Periplaneta americana]